MVVAAFTFLLTMSLVLGAYSLFVLRPEAHRAWRLRQRLELGRERPVGSHLILRKAAAESGTGLIGRVRAWHEQYAVRATARLLESAGMRTDPHWLIIGTILTWIVVVMTMRAVEAGWLATFAAGGLTPFIPYSYIRFLARRRLRAFEEIFPDAISFMARALRAGHALTKTLALVAEDVADPVRSEFRQLCEQHNYGLPLQQVMRTFATRIPLVDVRFFVTAVLTQRETGGNLAEVLDNLASVMRDRSRVRRQLSVVTAQGRTTGWFLAAVPVLVAGVMYMLNPEQMHAFVRDPIGYKLLMTAILLEVTGVVLIRRILALEY